MEERGSRGIWRSKRREFAAESLIEPDECAQSGLIGKVASAELKHVVSEMGYPGLLAWDNDGTVRLANDAAAETLGRSLDEIVGMDLVDLAEPAEEIKHTILDIAAGRFIAVHSYRTARVRGGEDRKVLAASRGIEVDGSRAGVTIFVTESEAGRLGRHPSQTWLDLVPVAVGYTDGDWIIKAVSTEVQWLIDQRSEAVMSRCLLDLVDPEDVDELRGTALEGEEPRSLPRVRFVLPSGGEVEVCVLLAPLPEPGVGVRFALVGRIESYFPQQHDRVAELELHLRRIGAEVRAAGVLGAASAPLLQDHPELGQLSARQWEILNRLVDGQRVPTIANELFISQSTVRNHLSMIYRRFGVHSQVELLQRMRQPARR
jgi:DNA-binding CsgD family transcriptional regulator/PAS domain-containing protein